MTARTDRELVDDRIGLMDTLPFFRSAIQAAGLESVIVAVVGRSPVVAAHWSTPVAFLFIDGGHAEDVAMADYEGWAEFVAPGGILAIHDVFEHPDEGGQAPFRVWQRAVADGFAPVANSPRRASKRGSPRSDARSRSLRMNSTSRKPIVSAFRRHSSELTRSPTSATEQARS